MSRESVLACDEQSCGIVKDSNTKLTIKIMKKHNNSSDDKKDRVITLLTNFNRLTLRVMKLKVKDRQALGLLAEAMQINKQMLSLVKDNKISFEFVRQTFSVIAAVVKETVSKWLFRYNLTPLMALKLC